MTIEVYYSNGMYADCIENARSFYHTEKLFCIEDFNGVIHNYGKNNYYLIISE